MIPYFDTKTDYFQQDNCPIHKAKITKDFLIDNDIPVIKWPPYSHDLNCIENAWTMLKNAIQGIVVNSNDEYWELISSTWMNEELIPTAELDKLILSTTHRCE